MMSLNTRMWILLFLSLVLTMVPLPWIMSELRPPFIVMLVLATQIFLPQYFSITALFLLGLCMDVMLSTAIGEHALALIMTTWCASGMARRFPFFSMIQQMVLVALFAAVYALTLQLVDFFLGYNTTPWPMLITMGLGFCLWPWVCWLAKGMLLRPRIRKIH